MEHFCCDCCNDLRPLVALLDLDCHCSICTTCCEERLRPCMVPLKAAAGPAAAEYAVGDVVRYRQRDGKLCLAKVVQVDRSIQPWGYGVELEGNPDIRFTEGNRLLPQHLSSDCLQQGFPVVRCPNCSKQLNRQQLARILPVALQQLDEALTSAWLEAKGIICCPTPGCEALIEQVPAVDSSSSGLCTCGNGNAPNTSGGSTCSSCQAQHKAANRYRCSCCSNSFCSGCRTVPYHEGLSCREAAAPCCPFCDARVPDAAVVITGDMSIRQLRDATTSLGADCSWCLERGELVSVYKRAKQVCSSGSCRSRLSELCTRQLPCGHFCCGVRGTSPCLPCFQEGCNSQARLEGDGNCCFCFEPLPSAAVIALDCEAGHFVHLACAWKCLQVGCPGPALTFDFLFCPLCGSGKEGRCGNIQVMTAQPHLQHSQLQAALDRPLSMRQQVVQLAKQRLKLEGAAKQDEQLQPGGKFDGRPVDWALSKYVFFECSKCRLPYYGGARQCGAAAPAAAGNAPAAYDATELVCGGCSAQAAGNNCPMHGTEFVAWKCKYCCNVASWYCWGATHMCSRCHDNPSQRYGHRCPGPGRCLLAVPHPPPGKSACLGCEACRHQDG